MIVKEEKISCVPLCPVHLIGMGLADLKLVWPFSKDVGTIEVSRCREPGCIYTYSRTDGYFRFYAGGSIKSEEGLLSLCPEHRRPLYMSEYDSQCKTITWGCPEAGCVKSEKRRMGHPQKKVERSRRHHYVPEFYLKSFGIKEDSANKGRLWRFERGASVPIAVPPRRAAVEIDYNTVALPSGERTDVFEKFLSTVETGVNSILPNAICTEGRVLNHVEREKLAFFIVISMLRVPESRNRINKLRADIAEMSMHTAARVPGRFESLMEEVEARTGKKPGATPQQVREFILGRKYRIKVPSIVSLDMMFREAKELWPVIFHMQWNVLTTDSDDLFFTSDNPVVYVNPHAGGFWGGALLDVGVELTFPISPRRCLVATHDALLRQKAAACSTPQEVGHLISSTPVKMNYDTASNVIVREINRRTVRRATRWVFSSTNNVGLQRFMEKHFHVRVEGDNGGKQS
jgi:hypothetical protein